MTKVNNQCLGRVPATRSPVAAVSSDRAGMKAFFDVRGVRYAQANEYLDDKARDDARLAAHQFGVFRDVFLDCPEFRESEEGRALIEAHLASTPPIVERGVIDGLAICFINDLIGYGCFVQRDVAKGEHVCAYMGIVSEASMVGANNAYIMDMNPWHISIEANAYFGIIDIPDPWPKMVVDGSDFGNEARFVNHIEVGALLMGTSSRAANLDVRSFFCSGRPGEETFDLFHVVLVAARDIEAGEELRFDYSDEYWRDSGSAPESSSVYRLKGDRIVEVPVAVPESK
jgi:hypothetical protein